MRYLCCFCVSLALAYAQSQELAIDHPIERIISGSDKHTYTLILEAGQYLDAVVDQHGVDVVVRVLAPDGRQLMEVDSPNGDEGPEVVQFRAETKGKYQLEVRALDAAAKPGRYVASIREVLSPAQYAARQEEIAGREAAASARVSANAVRLQSTEAGHGFADMDR
jgi:hypothetical protein